MCLLTYYIIIDICLLHSNEFYLILSGGLPIRRASDSGLTVHWVIDLASETPEEFNYMNVVRRRVYRPGLFLIVFINVLYNN